MHNLDDFIQHFAEKRAKHYHVLYVLPVTAKFRNELLERVKTIDEYLLLMDLFHTLPKEIQDKIEELFQDELQILRLNQ